MSLGPALTPGAQRRGELLRSARAAWALVLSLLGLGYPAVVDGAYAASAPMRFCSQTLDQYEYCRVITDSVRRVSPGCPAAVRSALHLLCLWARVDV